MPYAALALLHAMDDATSARHANPWSVWTRVPLLFLFVLAIWSRVWIGPWAWGIVVALAIWTLVNPRAFPPPRSTENRASKAVLGERVWLNRHAVPIPAHHAVAPNLLVALSLLGSVAMALWLVVLDRLPTLLGASFAFFGKMWFVGRMARLWEDVRDADPAYRGWVR